MKIFNYILAVLVISSGLTFGQTVYRWVGGSNGNWSTPSNWSPDRTNGQTTDVMLFNCGAQVTVNEMPQQTIGKLNITGNTNVVFIPASGNPKTLSINGTNGEAFSIESNSSLQIFSNDPRYGIFLNAGVRGTVNGTLTFRGNSSNYINAEDENAIIFNPGSVLMQQCPGNVFTAAGTQNVAVFKNNSEFVSNSSSASSPFGLVQPLSKVVFENGSAYSQQNSTMPQGLLSGRTFADLEFDNNVYVQYTENMTADFTVNNLIVKNNCIVSLNNTNSSYTPALNIKGDLNVSGTFSIAGSSKIKINFNGQGAQSITGSGLIGLTESVAEVRMNNTAGVTLDKDITASCPVVVTGKLKLGNSRLTGTVVQTQTGQIIRDNGYIIGKLYKYFSNNNPSAVFEIGTENGYSPVTLTFEKPQNSGYVSVSSVQTVHPLIQNQNEAMKRYWTVASDSLKFVSYAAEFSYRSCDFNTNFTEAQDEGSMELKEFTKANSIINCGLNINSRDTANNKIQVSNIKHLGDFTCVKNLSVYHLNNITTNNENSGIPAVYNLSQNYPNPFNPSTKMNYSLPVQSRVELKVFDINGKEVKTIVNSTQEAGYYTVQFNSENLSSGVYFYRLTTSNSSNNFTKTMKMVLVK